MSKGRRAQRSLASLLASVWLVALAVVPAGASPIADDECLSCHSDFDHGKFKASVHSKNACVDCHRITETPHDDVPKVDCASCHSRETKLHLLSEHGRPRDGGAGVVSCQDCHGDPHTLQGIHAPSSPVDRHKVASTCGACHEQALKDYTMSVHGQAAAHGMREAPVCTDCHGEHTIRSRHDPASKVYATALAEKVCAQCHAAEKVTSKFGLPSDRVETFMHSFHGLAAKTGVKTVANCASCHGSHKILPSSDSRSSVHKSNLVQTCGQCHEHAGENIARGRIHVTPWMPEENAAYWVRVFYLFLIGATVGGMVLHNLLDFMAKFRAHLSRRRREHQQPRFNRSERLQHWVLALVFIGLVYTGFALRYSEQWWAIPMGGSGQWRPVAHRACAVVFSLLAFYHLGYLFLTRRGRKQLGALWLRRKDLGDVVAMVNYNLGLRATKPRLGHYSYIEKIEYWALIWGSVVMMATGVLMSFDDWTLRVFPKWFFDVVAAVHFYEAVLATLAIVLWHFYFTIFDPEHYPLNTSMNTGRSDHPSEIEDEDERSGPKKF